MGSRACTVAVGHDNTQSCLAVVVVGGEFGGHSGKASLSMHCSALLKLEGSRGKSSGNSQAAAVVGMGRSLGGKQVQRS